MSVDVAAAPAPEAGGDPGRCSLTAFFAMLDGAAAREASLRTRLCLLTAFSRAADQVFTEPRMPAVDPLHELVTRHSAIVGGLVAPSLAAHQLTVVRWEQLTRDMRARLSQLFARRLYPALTPLTVDSTHPFPQPPSLSLNLAITVLDHGRGRERFATLTIPPTLPRLIRVSNRTLLPLETLVAANLHHVFPGASVESVQCFRVTRARGRGLTAATRLEHETSADEATVRSLRRGLGVDDAAVFGLRSSLLMGPALAALIPLAPGSSRRQMEVVSSGRTTTAARAATRSDQAGVGRHRRRQALPQAGAAIEAKAG
jgi:hypothetical protein